MDKENRPALSQAIILAGGFGTRLKSVVADRPKALAMVAGKPFIEHQLEWLMEQGITTVTLAVHHMADQLQEFVEQWTNDKIVIDTVYEEKPLGTGGAVVNVIQQKSINGKVLVINGDTLFNFTVQPILEYMQNKKEPILLIASKFTDASRFGTITVDNGYVTSFLQSTGIHSAGVVNSGAYLIDSIFFRTKKIKQFSLEYDLFPEMVTNKNIIAYTVDKLESFFDIGTPDSYREICNK